MRKVQRFAAVLAGAASLFTATAFANPAAAGEYLLVDYNGYVHNGFLYGTGSYSDVWIGNGYTSVQLYRLQWGAYGIVDACYGYSLDGYDYLPEQLTGVPVDCYYSDVSGHYTYRFSGDWYLHTAW